MTKAKNPLESWTVITVGRVGCFRCVSVDYKQSGKLRGLAFVQYDGVSASLYFCRKHARAEGCPIVGARLRESQERTKE